MEILWTKQNKQLKRVAAAIEAKRRAMMHDGEKPIHIARLGLMDMNQSFHCWWKCVSWYSFYNVADCTDANVALFHTLFVISSS
jgi:hypothetical protein